MSCGRQKWQVSTKPLQSLRTQQRTAPALTRDQPWSPQFCASFLPRFSLPSFSSFLLLHHHRIMCRPFRCFLSLSLHLHPHLPLGLCISTFQLHHLCRVGHLPTGTGTDRRVHPKSPRWQHRAPRKIIPPLYCRRISFIGGVLASSCQQRILEWCSGLFLALVLGYQVLGTNVRGITVEMVPLAPRSTTARCKVCDAPCRANAATKPTGGWPEAHGCYFLFF